MSSSSSSLVSTTDILDGNTFIELLTPPQQAMPVWGKHAGQVKLSSQGRQQQLLTVVSVVQQQSGCSQKLPRMESKRESNNPALASLGSRTSDEAVSSFFDGKAAAEEGE
ncbi:expressed unknown protein [Seminavis robusta]|uniref:Uncharacterized protein n=1 Tax=Seminavis robusta TaxID=568900 RepID=A0A9N8DRG0_9STRA|nr:expressed unknown protein [Seminavis robusta]|eukprot:Sro302_g112120.1 n/a (110) ;mRNA; f:3718-4047